MQAPSPPSDLADRDAPSPDAAPPPPEADRPPPPPEAKPAARPDSAPELPHAVDAERAVLGALLLNNDLFTQIGHILKNDFFYNTRHRLLYDHMQGLYDKGHVDPVLLAQRLSDGGQLSEAGGADYIADIADIGAAPVNILAYAELIRDKAFIRRLINAHNDGISDSHHPGDKDPPKLLDDAETRLSDISDLFRRGEGGVKLIKDTAKNYVDKIFEHHDNMAALRGINPGYPKLYRLTQGLHGGDLVILAGRPGAGKTAFGLNLLRNIAEQPDTGALCFSLEMSAEQLVMRMLAHHGLNMHKMRGADSISSATLAQLAAASSQLESLPVHIDDSGTLNILEARTRARQIKRILHQNGQRMGIIMVDYLQLMEAPTTNGRYDNRALEVSQISRGLKALAKELDTPILALSQLNRSVEKRPDQRPVMSDLRESGAIEQDADLILFLHSQKTEEDDNPYNTRAEVELIIGKQRSGPTGKILMEFDKAMSKFTETTKPSGADPYADEH